jgi:uncharacterized protein GlcG (DUF336 family)
MTVSYGETSGFVPVLNDELQAVNGGMILLVVPSVVVAAVGAVGIVIAENSRNRK